MSLRSGLGLYANHKTVRRRERRSGKDCEIRPLRWSAGSERKSVIGTDGKEEDEG
jgi:hypothetical protein